MKIGTGGRHSLCVMTIGAAALWLGVAPDARGQVYNVGCDVDDLVEVVSLVNAGGGTLSLDEGCDYVFISPASEGDDSALPTITGTVEIFGNGARLIRL